jgi:hypothetical protein
MIRHVVLIDIKADAPPDAATRMVEGARTLLSRIPIIRQWEVGLGLRDGGASVGIVGVFDNMDDFLAYMAHPAHKEVAQEYIVPVMEHAMQVQFEIEDEKLERT